MSILAVLFVSTPADALAYETLAYGKSENNRSLLESRYELVEEYGNITGLEFEVLWAVLADEPWDTNRHGLKEIAVSDQGGTWLLQFPDEFVQDLASLDASSIASVASRWAHTEDLHGSGPETLVEILKDLQRLACIAQSKGQGMYLWGSL